MAGGATRATGIVLVSAVGEPATARSAGVAGPTESDDCRAQSSDRTGRLTLARKIAAHYADSVEKGENFDVRKPDQLNCPTAWRQSSPWKRLGKTESSGAGSSRCSLDLLGYQLSPQSRHYFPFANNPSRALSVGVYDELRCLARRYMRHERPGHSLQTTALVNMAEFLARAESARKVQSL